MMPRPTRPERGQLWRNPANGEIVRLIRKATRGPQWIARCVEPGTAKNAIRNMPCTVHLVDWMLSAGALPSGELRT